MRSSKHIIVLVSCILHIGGGTATFLRRTTLGLDTFDKPGNTPIAQTVKNDRDGALQYSPNITFVTSGGNTPDVVCTSLSIVVGIKPKSAPNLAVAKGDKTLYSEENCARLKSLWFGCTQVGAEPAANLPLSCTMTVEAFGPKYPGGPDEFLDSQTFAFRPHLTGQANPLRVTAEMQEAVITLGSARKFKVSSASTDTQALRGLLSLVRGLRIPINELPDIITKLLALFANISDVVVDLLLDDIGYETNVACPA